ncbi:replication-associated recombination protein A [Candidatus Dojkabacteria bacterium]|nr:replication-associated recombination protein A [Candidatus Dojkabacteria bacterium]
MQDTLFSSKPISKTVIPLAEILRPINLEQFAGQEKLVGENGILKKFIDSDDIPSMILWGPPGVGKTSLARIIAKLTKSKFIQISAVSSGKKDMQDVIKISKETLQIFHGRRTILFIDEIHRFNKAQQDYLLPFVEDGTIVLIGATTENPSFEVISALLSRCRVFVMDRHDEHSLLKIFNRAKEYFKTNGVDFSISNSARKLLFLKSNGDPRTMINMLEIAVKFYIKEDTKLLIQEKEIEDISKSTKILFDKSGEEHYNIASALIKSMRASDPNAALYWLARLIEGGEDPKFIARRCAILASEDIGNADPQALILANTVFDAVIKIGWPESRIILSQLVIYLANAPKDNTAYTAIEKALLDARDTLNLAVPMHLRNAPTKLMKDLGYGKGYQYDHNSPNKKSGQQCLPDILKDKKYV